MANETQVKQLLELAEVASDNLDGKVSSDGGLKIVEIVKNASHAVAAAKKIMFFGCESRAVVEKWHWKKI